MSTSAQLASPERQLAAFATYCDRWSLTDAGHYEDLGVSATHVAAADRTGLQALLADARKRSFDVVFVEELSRAARRAEEYFPLHAELRRLGVALVTPHDDPTREVGAAQRFAQGVMALAAELEAGLLGERVRNALALKVKQGQYRGGNISLGYRWDKPSRTWQVDEPAADLARTVFRTYLQTRNLEQAAAALNAAGHVTGKGNPWTGCSIRVLLRAPMYRGYLRFAGTDYPCAGLPEVIPPDLLAAFEQCAATIQGRSQRCDQSPRALFTGLLRCPGCGRWLSLHIATKHGNSYLAYYCHRARCEPHDCPARRYVGQGPMERALLPMLAEHLRHLARELPPPTRRKAGQAVNTARARERLEGERQRVLRLHVSGRITEEELDIMLGQVQVRLGALEVPQAAPAPTLTRAQVQQLTREIARYWQEWPVPRRRQLLQQLVEHITPDPADLNDSTVVWRF